MSQDQHEPHGRRWRVAAVVAGCLVALALPYFVIAGLIDRGQEASPAVATAAGRSSSSPTTAGAPGATTSSSTTGTASATATASDAAATLAKATEACRLASLRLRTALAAGDVSMAQFDKHIDAMNLLVAGKISLAVATQFWDETRVGAMENVAAFTRSEKAVGSSRSACAALKPDVASGLPYGEVTRLTSCAGYVSAGRTALARAHTAVTTWNHHVHDMEMLREGKITPAQATAAWHKNWHTGEKQLQAYQAAAKKANAAPCSLT